MRMTKYSIRLGLEEFCYSLAEREGFLQRGIEDVFGFEEYERKINQKTSNNFITS